MSSNEKKEKSSGSECAIPTETVSQNSIDIRIDKDDLSGKSDESVSSKQTAVTNDSAQNNIAYMNCEHRELQVPSVSSSSNSDGLLQSFGLERSKSGLKISERVKGKSWYNVIYPSYKTRAETFKKLFREVPEDQRLIVDYSCALQREILVHGRMYVSQDYMCFHANIFGWETFLNLRWRNVTSITKEKTALVIPNAILISTEVDKYFITSFAARDKTYLMLFRIWQNALMEKSMLPQEIWQVVHSAYGDQLGLTSDDEDYIDPKNEKSECEVDKPGTETIFKRPNTTSKTETDQSHEKRPSAEIVAGCSTRNSDSMTLRPPPRRMRKDLDTNDFPTDGSNSTDSEDESSVPFESTAECTSLHEGRQLMHTILPINVDGLLTMLFSKSKFFAEFHNMRKTTNMVYRDWVDNDDGTKTRTLNFTVAVTQAVGPKTSNMTEVQVMRECSVPGQLYSIDTKSTNAGIPYADSFHIVTHFCLMRTVDDHTMLSIYAQIKYTKNVWGVIKGFIEKNCWAGLENFYKDLLKSLQSECCIPPAKSKSRRNKRALSQKSSIEEAPSKRSSLKATTKTVPVPSTVPQTTSANVSKRNTLSTQRSSEIIPHQRSGWSFLTFDMFFIFVAILIIALILLNLYLLHQLYVSKHKQANSIQIDRALLDQLNGDPNEIRQNWLKLLNHQTEMHESELVKWQGFVKSAVDLLQNIKEIYSKINLDLKTAEESVKDEF